ncbi:MAG TPA: ABC transporter permease [Oligoflexia bacterium]|nr:ABC transporter permease [Oligoflexia bacterium]HMR24548.1 ABC transporter permease [Oligoflexia bacterium]
MANTVEKKQEERVIVEGTSLWKDAYRRLKKNKPAMVCLYVVLFLVLLCFLGPWVIDTFFPSYSYRQTDLVLKAQPPSLKHWFGTDFLGRDLFSRVLMGGKISIKIGLIAAIVAAIFGTVYGAISGYASRRVDNLMMRFVDVMYSLPYMFLVIIFITMTDSKSEVLLFAALGLVGWLTTARIVRGQVLGLKNREFVLAAKSVGVSSAGIIFKHLIPNTLGPVIIYFTLTVPTMILQEAFLSFLGLGVQPPKPSLGSLINDGANHMIAFWWELVFPGMFMAILLFCLNFLGDGVRDALDPQMRKD